MNSRKQNRINEHRAEALHEMAQATGAPVAELENSLAANGISPTQQLAQALRNYCGAFEPRKTMSPPEIVKLLKGV